MQLPAIQFSKNPKASIPSKPPIARDKTKNPATSAGHICQFTALGRTARCLSVFYPVFVAASSLPSGSLTDALGEISDSSLLPLPSPNHSHLPFWAPDAASRRTTRTMTLTGGRQQRIIRMLPRFVKPLSQTIFHPIVHMWKTHFASLFPAILRVSMRTTAVNEP